MENPRIKQLQDEYRVLTDEVARIDKLIDIALEVRNIDVEKGFEMAEEIIDRSEKAGYLRGKGRGYNLAGWCYWQQGNYDAGVDILSQAYAIAKKVDDKPFIARVLNNFGYIYRDRGDLAEALNYFEKALAINESIGDKVAQSVNLASIAYLHYDLNDYDNALEFALRCIPIFEEADDEHRLITLYHILGNIYFKQEQYAEALRYFEENVTHANIDTMLHALAISGIGKVYYKMQDFERALRYLTNALDLGKELGNVEVQIVCHFYLGRIDMDEGSYRKAHKELEAAFALAEGHSRKHDIMSIHEMLSVLYDKVGDIPKAFHHLKTFGELKEEIFKQTTFNKLRNLQIRQQIELAQKEKEVAEKTAMLKQQFMANMSHEIRTPMNAIVGMTRLLLEKEPKPDQLRYLNAIQQSADNLLVIINDILDLSKIEAGKIEIEHTDFALREVMQSVADMLMLKSEEKKIDFRTTVDEKIPRRLIGDPTRIHQILLNLASNAVKFTEKGHVEIKVSIERSESKRHLLRFDVIDTGIGIAEGYVGSIFESFTQAGSDVTRKFGGTGLGLTISKQLASLMNGDIVVSSELGKGTVFTVFLPLEEATSQEDAEKPNLVNDDTLQRLENIRILLVEDNEFNRMVAEDTLREAIPSAKIDMAFNGKEAVEKIVANPYDVVLMDIQMPVMDGVEATQAIRQELKSDIHIIAMTANVLQEDIQRYLEVGMNAHIAKPFQKDELLLKMAMMMNNPLKTQESHATTAGKEPVSEIPLPDKVTDMEFLQKFTAGNPEKMNKYISMFLENAPKLLATVNDSLIEKNLPAIKIAAHSLKPQLSYMGVKEDISNIFLIEQTAGEAGHTERLQPLIAQLNKVCDKAFQELNLYKATELS
ncbi:MAG TPA: tetratricopeptide repeat protein [Flavipsychrobacter sp.]|nr:tetratricopeptide repeat protein [Flavipsychrobacter sp.]